MRTLLFIERHGGVSPNGHLMAHNAIQSRLYRWSPAPCVDGCMLVVGLRCCVQEKNILQY